MKSSTKNSSLMIECRTCGSKNFGKNRTCATCHQPLFENGQEYKEADVQPKDAYLYGVFHPDVIRDIEKKFGGRPDDPQVAINYLIECRQKQLEEDNRPQTPRQSDLTKGFQRGIKKAYDHIMARASLEFRAGQDDMAFDLISIADEVSKENL